MKYSPPSRQVRGRAGAGLPGPAVRQGAGADGEAPGLPTAEAGSAIPAAALPGSALPAAGRL